VNDAGEPIRPRFLRDSLLILGISLAGLLGLLAVVDGNQKTMANLANQIVVHALLFGAGAAATLALRRRHWAHWVLIPLLVLIWGTAIVVWHQTPPLAE